MMDFDVGSIVPSTRDLYQVIATKKRSLALVGLLGPERAAEEAARLYDLDVSAFAFAEPGPAMQLGARATKTVPSLCLLPVTEKDPCLAARFYGADGVCVDASLPLDDWDRLAKQVRTMRMLPIAFASDAASADAAVKAGARVVLVRAASVAEAIELAKPLPRALTLVAEIPGADADALRALVSHFDAAIVPPGVHSAKGYADLVAEVDP
jgi:hypothetical protein